MSKRTNSERDEEKAEKAQLAEYESDSGSGSGLAFDAYVFDTFAKSNKKKGNETKAAKYTDMADDAWINYKGNQKFGYEPHGTGEPESPAVLRALQLEPESAVKASELLDIYTEDKPYRRRTGAELNKILGPDSGPVGLFEPSRGAAMMDEMDDEANINDESQNLDLGFDYNEKLPSTPEKEKGGRLNKKRRNTKRHTKRKIKKTRRKGRTVTKRKKHHNRRK